jgi:hypothetical protein
MRAALLMESESEPDKTINPENNMKKLILIASLITSFTALSALGQGYFHFFTGKSQVWDQLDGGGSPALSTSINTAFLWAPNGSVPMVSSLGASSPVSGFPIYTASSVWTAILTDPNFTPAINNANGQMAIQRTSSFGSISYNSGISFPVTGTSVGTGYSVFMIGWDGAYATPALAQAASAGVGWSAPFSYTAVAFTTIPNTMSGVTPAFGVWGVPEPSALALAGLGGLSLMLLRRRK